MLLQSVFLLCFAILTEARTHLGRTAQVIEARQLSKETTYDFIIAGGGIAGLTVADRLTENPNGTFIACSKGCKLIMSNSHCTSHRVWPV